MSSSNVSPPAVGASTGWFVDPWAPGWRWRSGGAWTPYRIYREDRPKLPPWISAPVLIVAPFALWESVELLIWYPGAAALILVPLTLVLLVFRWLDSTSPEPREGRIHALLWGFVISGFIAGLVNSSVESSYGILAALVLSAPIVEEVTKGALLLMAVRRAEIDGPVDGAIYAAWSAAGFAASENLFYFTMAASEGWLAEEFIARGIFMPLAHPMFTIPIGLLVGAAVRRGRNPTPAYLVGLIPAIGAHSLWNYGVFLGEEGDLAASEALSTLFVVLFLGWIVAITAIKRAHAQAMERSADLLAVATRLFPTRAAAIGGHLQAYATPAMRRRFRRSMPRHVRRRFDAGVVLYSRAMLRSRADDPIAPVEFQVFLDHLTAAVESPAPRAFAPPEPTRPPATLAAERPPSDWWRSSTDSHVGRTSNPKHWWA